MRTPAIAGHREKRIQIDDEDFYVDLLFYNRKLRRLVALDLKVGAFKAEHKGQMELYLRWLDRHEREPGEETPLGIILCAGKRREQRRRRSRGGGGEEGDVAAAGVRRGG